MPAWLSGWNHRKSHIIDPATGAGVDYPIRLKVHKDDEDVRPQGNMGISILEGGLVSYPSAFYYNGRTYFVWQGNNNPLDWYINYIDHATGTLGTPVMVATGTIADNEHGYPSICITNDGYILIAYDFHGSFRVKRSSNPEDITAWDAATIPFGYATYPRLVKVSNGDIYLIVMHGGVTAESNKISISKSVDGGQSWGGATTIIVLNSSPLTSCYSGNFAYDSVNNRIHIAWTRFIVSRLNIYHAYYNVSDGNMYDMAGNNLGTSISNDEAEANCLVKNSGATGTGIPCVHLDSDGYAHILYLQFSAGSNYDVRYVKWDGAAWVDSDTGANTDDDDNTYDFNIITTSNIDAYLITTGLAGHGGDIEKWHFDGTNWTQTSIIRLQGTGYALDYPVIPLNGVLSEVELYFTEVKAGDYVTNDLRVFFYGAALADCNGEVWLNGNCKDDFGDVRFTDDNGITLLNYWIETKVDGDYAYFWVKIADSLESDPQTIYIYYDKPDASTTSSGANTFSQFDDFTDLDDWTNDEGTGSVSIENEQVKLIHNINTFAHIERSMTVDGSEIRVKLKRTETSTEVTWALALGLYFNQYDYTAIKLTYQTGNEFDHICYADKNGTITYSWITGTHWVSDTYEWLRIRLTATTVFIDISPDGIKWTNVYSTARAATWVSPTLVIIGHGYEANGGSYPNADWDNSVAAGASITGYADQYIARKYVSPEPAHSTWGIEETFVPIGSSCNIFLLMEGMGLI